ncbi:MAG: GatB/YqeY domain-containing protein [Planctomycetes bacterium]|nr:GatB/YqeY domain-containing protein [Planctomycetota bacterium]
MSLKTQLEADLKQAMLQKNETVRDTLRLLLSEFKRLEIQEGQTLTPQIEQDVLLKAVKQRQQSIAEFDKAARMDLSQKEREEMDVIQRYLPKQLSEEETRRLVMELITELQVASKKDIGMLMKPLMAKYKGQIDGKLVQKIAGELLP